MNSGVRRRWTVVAVLVLMTSLLAVWSQPVSATEPASRTAVTSVSPNVAVAYGGTRVQVTGANFTHVTKVTFGSVVGSQLVVQDSRQLLVTAPAHAAGTVDVVVHGANSTSAVVPADRFHYGVPIITSVAPTSGLYTGATRVTIKGDDFAPNSTVMFGNLPGTHVVVSAWHSLTVTAPSHAAGLVNIHVTTNYGTSQAKAANAYLFIGPSRPISWSNVQTADPSQGETKSVSCPTDTFCAMVDLNGFATIYDGQQWSSLRQVGIGPLWNISCAAANSCLATGTAKTAIYNGAGWVSGPPLPATSIVSKVDCPSTTFCLARDAITGGFYTYDGHGWTAVANPDRNLTDFSCATVTFCVAVDNQGFGVTFDGTTWSATTAILSGTPLIAVSCPTTTFCAAMAVGGAPGTRTVMFDGSSWSAPIAADSYTGEALDCSSATFCVIADGGGRIVRYDGAGWSQPVAVADVARTQGLSCASAQLCVAATSAPRSTPRFDGSTWSIDSPDPDQGGIDQLSCPTSSFCLAGDAPGNGLFFDGSSWTSPGVIPVGMRPALSCASPSFCVAIHGQALVFDGQRWRTPSTSGLDSADHEAIACPSSTRCVAIDSAGNGTETFNGYSWTSLIPTTLPSSNRDIFLSCAATSFCMAISEDGSSAIFNGGSWRTAPHDGLVNTSGVSCIMSTYCYAIDNTHSTVSRYNGSSWTTPVVLGLGVRPTGISCTSTTRCVLSTAEKTTYVFDGATWSAPSPAPLGGLIDCPTTTACVIADPTSAVSTR